MAEFEFPALPSIERAEGFDALCPHCQRPTVMVAQPQGYATARWSGQVPEEPYVRCPLCTATFPLRAFD